jgi:hypothetical protein
MTRDPLDELLDRSAPATRAADRADLRERVGAAARKIPSARRRRIGIPAGALEPAVTSCRRLGRFVWLRSANDRGPVRLNDAMPGMSAGRRHPLA